MGNMAGQDSRHRTGRRREAKGQGIVQILACILHHIIAIFHGDCLNAPINLENSF